MRCFTGHTLPTGFLSATGSRKLFSFGHRCSCTSCTTLFDLVSSAPRCTGFSTARGPILTSIFRSLQATEEMIREEFQSWNRDVCEGDESDERDFKKGMPIAMYCRLDNYLDHAKDIKLCSMRGGHRKWHLECAVINIRQNREYTRHIATNVMPALLRQSVLYDLVTDRPLIVAEYWIVHGWAHPGCESIAAELRREFPFPSLVSEGPSELKAASQRCLLGNGMHWCQIGLWVLYSASFLNESR